MARIDRSAFIKLEIVQEASKQFLEKGYTSTTVSMISKALGMSPGNLTYHYPTKEHLLAELVAMLCDFQWKMVEKEANDGLSSVMGICLELASMASACEEDEIIKDFFLSSYTSPMSLDIIRKNDAKRAAKVFGSYCPDWSKARFDAAEILCSGVEYATLMTAGNPVPLEKRIEGALHNILSIYGLPEDIQETKIRRVFSLGYRELGSRILTEFRQFVEQVNEQAFFDLIKR